MSLMRVLLSFPYLKCCLFQETYLPLLMHSLAIACVGICIFGGLKWIERVNTILVSLLLCIVIITFGWALSLRYSEIGIKFLFTPNWGKQLLISVNVLSNMRINFPWELKHFVYDNEHQLLVCQYIATMTQYGAYSIAYNFPIFINSHAAIQLAIQKSIQVSIKCVTMRFGKQPMEELDKFKWNWL